MTPKAPSAPSANSTATRTAGATSRSTKRSRWRRAATAADSADVSATNRAGKRRERSVSAQPGGPPGHPGCSFLAEVLALAFLCNGDRHHLCRWLHRTALAPRAHTGSAPPLVDTCYRASLTRGKRRTRGDELVATSMECRSHDSNLGQMTCSDPPGRLAIRMAR